MVHDDTSTPNNVKPRSYAFITVGPYDSCDYLEKYVILYLSVPKDPESCEAEMTPVITAMDSTKIKSTLTIVDACFLVTAAAKGKMVAVLMKNDDTRLNTPTFVLQVE